MIPDLTTYEIRDLVPIPADAWARLFERANAAVFPAQILLAVLLLVGGVRVARGRGGRMTGLGLAAAWGLCAVAFHLDALAELTWAGTVAAGAFALQAIWLAALAARGRLEAPEAPGPAHRLGLGIAALGLVGMPLGALFQEGSASAAPWVGISPDATVCTTLGALLALGPAPVTAWILPVLWLVPALGIAAALGGWTGPVTAAAGGSAIAAALAHRWSRSRDA